jgi:rSAM/selenodomain-associated transferase 1
MSTQPTLLVFLKYPAEGEVKTRLARSIGACRAAGLYRQWIGTVFERIQPLRPTVHIIGYFTGADRDAFVTWQHFADDWWPQPAGDLGSRLEAGFAKGHALGGPVAAIGTDCLELDAPLVQLAFDRLKQFDAVFGPAVDGGYYLVGTARHLPAFFDDIPWSVSNTLMAHLGQCERNGWSVSLLPARRDIDSWEDIESFRA